MDIEAPRVAQSAKPGQFIILRLDEKGERVPLTIADYEGGERLRNHRDPDGRLFHRQTL